MDQVYYIVHRASYPVPFLEIITTTRDNPNEGPAYKTNIQGQNPRNVAGLDTPIRIRDKCDWFHLPVVQFLLECETELFGSPKSVLTPSTVLAMWPNPYQAQHCHLCSLAIWERTRFVVVGEFQHGCVGVKFGGWTIVLGDSCGVVTRAEVGREEISRLTINDRSDLLRILTNRHLSVFYRHSAVNVIEGKTIRSEFPRVMMCEGSREIDSDFVTKLIRSWRESRSMPRSTWRINAAVPRELWITCLHRCRTRESIAIKLQLWSFMLTEFVNYLGWPSRSIAVED